MPIKAVFFDLGETLIDETRMWREWAAYMDVPEQTFMAALEDGDRAMANITIAPSNACGRVLIRRRPSASVSPTGRVICSSRVTSIRMRRLA